MLNKEICHILLKYLLGSAWIDEVGILEGEVKLTVRNKSVLHYHNSTIIIKFIRTCNLEIL